MKPACSFNNILGETFTCYLSNPVSYRESEPSDLNKKIKN